MMRLGFAAALVLVLSASAAQAQFFQDLYQGFQYAGTPTGGPTFTSAGGGRANGQRFGRTRIVPNKLGKGYRFEFDRNFGADQLGRPEIFNLGNLELQLSGATSMTAEATKRGIPTGKFDFNITNLNYSIRGLTGFQDAVVSGTLDLTNQVRINPLGFYTYSLNLNNTNAQVQLDGLAADGTRDTDFDIGPINVKGNVYFDGFVALLASFGVDTSNLVGVFPNSPIDRIVEEIQTSLDKQSGALTQQASDGSGLTLGELIDSGSGASLFGPDVSIELEPIGQPVATLGPTTVPEPATLLLLGIIGLAATRRR